QACRPSLYLRPGRLASVPASCLSLAMTCTSHDPGAVARAPAGRASLESREVRRRELAGHMQRTEAVSVGSYIDASPQIAKGAGAATKRIGGVSLLGAQDIEET